MSDTETKTEEVQKKYKSEIAQNALNALLEAGGFGADDLQCALEAIKTAKEQTPIKEKGAHEYYLDKTLVYEDQDACIFKRATSKSGRWYFRIYDSKRNNPVIKSLKTTDKTQALASARLLYMDIKGKIQRGERVKSLSSMELVQQWEDKLRTQITDIPHEGLTPDSFKQKQYFLKNWRDYLIHLGIHKTGIDKIETGKTRDFGQWLKNKPKETALWKKGRCLELVNNNISEVIRMYHQLAVRDKYIHVNQIPEIDRVKVQLDDSYKRDILNEEQYERFWKYIQFKYITKKHNANLMNPSAKKGMKELEIRKIWKEFIFIIANVGFRSKELLGIKMNEIIENPNWDQKRRETDVLMKVRKENSKTGRSRVCVAPVKKRIQRILASYKKLGISHEANDFLFINPLSKDRNSYGRGGFYYRLKDVLKWSGLQDELDKEEKSISLYSFRHQYACWRLRYGDVPIHLLAKQMGTSIDKIDKTYGHIEVEQEAEKITAAQSHIRATGTELTKPEAYEEDDTSLNLEELAKSHSYIHETIKSKSLSLK